jgi:hypothetical protein
MKFRRAIGFIALAFLLTGGSCFAQEKKTDAAPVKEGVLKPADLENKYLPSKVFFRGQVASVQVRNSGGVRYADGYLVMATLVDNSGYASGLKEKYQAYLITEVPLQMGGQTLKPGAYGVGFVENKFVVMDIGANDVFSVDSAKDQNLKPAMPLQMVAGEMGRHRLYKGRDYVEFSRVK